MVLFKKTVMGLPSISYESKVTGNWYPFENTRPTKIEVCGSAEQKKQRELDIEYFRAHSDFEEVTVGKKIAQKVIKTKEQIKSKAKKEPTYKEKLIALKSIDDELADAIMDRYDNWELFIESMDLLRLREISGIGHKRAKSVMAQVEAIRTEDIKE